MNTTEKGPYTTTIKIPKELGFLEDRTIEVPNTHSGAHMPIITFDYDGTLVDTANTHHGAAVQTVMMYTADLSRVPTLKQFQHGVPPDFYAWGVPRKVPMDEVWNIFQNFVIKIEQRSPSAFFGGVVTQIKEIATRFHIVIITLNSIHPISRIVKEAAGVDVDTLVVEDKAAVLRHLAHLHGSLYNKLVVPFYYFGDTTEDMKASSKSGGLVYPVAVARRERLKCANERQHLFEIMRSHGARVLVSHSRMIDVASGMVKADGAVLI